MPLTRDIGQLEPIEREVLEALESLYDRWEDVGEATSAWTRAVKDAVGGLAKAHSCTAYAASCQFEALGEWVYDLCWCEPVEGTDFIVDMPLALECEWARPGVLEDFQKLLVSRARYRVMVFWDPIPAGAEKTLRKLLTQIEHYRGKQAQDRFLFVAWIDSPDELRHWLYVVD